MILEIRTSSAKKDIKKLEKWFNDQIEKEFENSPEAMVEGGMDRIKEKNFSITRERQNLHMRAFVCPRAYKVIIEEEPVKVGDWECTAINKRINDNASSSIQEAYGWVTEIFVKSGIIKEKTEEEMKHKDAKRKAKKETSDEVVVTESEDE